MICIFEIQLWCTSSLARNWTVEYAYSHIIWKIKCAETRLNLKYMPNLTSEIDKLDSSIASASAGAIVCMQT